MPPRPRRETGRREATAPVATPPPSEGRRVTRRGRIFVLYKPVLALAEKAWCDALHLPPQQPMPPHYASRPAANICCCRGTAFGETSVTLYQRSQTVALGILEINILIKKNIFPFKNTRFHGLNSTTRCEFYFHTQSLLYVQGVYLD